MARDTNDDLTPDDVVRRLLREADAGDLSVSDAARVRAIELLGRHLGMFNDRPAGGVVCFVPAVPGKDWHATVDELRAAGRLEGATMVLPMKATKEEWNAERPSAAASRTTRRVDGFGAPPPPRSDRTLAADGPDVRRMVARAR